MPNRKVRNLLDKKFISSNLILGFLFNASFPSFASTLSEDGRLEVIEGNNIVINDILEIKDFVDFEIEGYSMINVASQKDSIAITSRSSSEGASKFDLHYLYPDTKYLIQFESDNTGVINKASLSGVEYQNYSVKKGINRFSITTLSEITSNELILDGSGFNLFNLVVTEDIGEEFDYFEGLKSVGQDDENGHRIEIEATNSSGELSNKIEIALNQPLRGTPFGVKDRIVRKDDEWVIERKFAEMVLDGSSDESWTINNPGHFVTGKKCNPVQKSGGAILSDKLASGYELGSSSMPNSIWCGNNQGIQSNKFTDVNTGKQWLSENPVTVIYELATPIYETLNIDFAIDTYLDTTYISNSSNIPANIKITLDRTANKVKEVIELARINPTAENIAMARMWIDLLEESTLKDEFEGELEEIIEIKDIMTMERKVVTANMDLYVKSENSLSMSLNTNNITFSSYSGVEDMEKLKAIELTINSSLPYNINACLESDILNADNTKSLDKELFNIKESSDNIYQKFNDNQDKITLKENCPSGNFITHNIDLKLGSSSAHTKDVYRAAIKIEVEQN